MNLPQVSPRTAAAVVRKVVLFLLPAAIGLGGCASIGLSPAPMLLGSSRDYVIVDTSTGSTMSLSTLIDRVAAADVVLFGENHDDPVAHALQLLVLEGVAGRRGRVALGMEMFDRDAQPALDRYMAGRTSEREMRSATRPWGNYETDYRPLVEVARSLRAPVIATNLPQSIATRIGREGIGVLDALPPEDRQWAASRHDCPTDEYWDRFVAALTEDSDEGHGDVPIDSVTLRRVYDAQCARDEAMAETIAASVEPGVPLLHINGAFHSDHGLGIVPRLRARAPDLSVTTISALPVEDPQAAPEPDDLARADYLILTPEVPED